MSRWHIPALTLAFTCWSVPYVNGFAFHEDDEHDPKTFKDIVQKLVRASRENLRPLKTYRIEMHPGRDYWYEVETMLLGATTCRIYEHPQMVYRCEWNRPKNTSLNAVYAKVVKDFEGALGQNEWTVRKAERRTRFEPVNPNRDPVIEVRIVGSKTSTLIEVMLFTVDRWEDAA